MKLILLVILSAAALLAQTSDAGPRKAAAFTVATLPSAATWSGYTVDVTDALTAGNCATGGGSALARCRSNGTTWANIGAVVTSVTASGTNCLTSTPTVGAVAIDIDTACIDRISVSTTITGAKTFTNDASVFGPATVEIEVDPPGTAAAVGDGKAYFYVPAKLNGMNLVNVYAQVYTAGTTGTINVDIDRCVAAATGNVCSSTVADMLSTNLTVDSGENSSNTAATAAVIDTANDDVATGQVLRINIDAIHTTPSQGLLVILVFKLP